MVGRLRVHKHECFAVLPLLAHPAQGGTLSRSVFLSSDFRTTFERGKASLILFGKASHHMNRLLNEHGLDQCHADVLALECIVEWRSTTKTVGARLKAVFASDIDGLRIRKFPWARLHLSNAADRSADIALWWHYWAFRLAPPLQKVIDRATITIPVNALVPCCRCGEPTGCWCEGCNDFFCIICEDEQGRCDTCIALVPPPTHGTTLVGDNGEHEGHERQDPGGHDEAGAGDH